MKSLFNYSVLKCLFLLLFAGCFHFDTEPEPPFIVEKLHV